MKKLFWEVVLFLSMTASIVWIYSSNASTNHTVGPVPTRSQDDPIIKLECMVTSKCER